MYVGRPGDDSPVDEVATAKVPLDSTVVWVAVSVSVGAKCHDVGNVISVSVLVPVGWMEVGLVVVGMVSGEDAGELPGVLSGVVSGVVSGVLSGVVSGVVSAVVSGVACELGLALGVGCTTGTSDTWSDAAAVPDVEGEAG